MTWISVIILAIIEGITELLPVSSTAHMMIAADVLKFPQTSFLTQFQIVVQLGAIAAVLSLYLKTLFSSKKLLISLAAAFVPTVIIGKVVYPVVRGVLLENVQFALMGLLLGGILLIVLDWVMAKRAATTSLTTLGMKKPMIIGACQMLAAFPGVSRSAATIIAGMGVGLSRTQAMEFSFLLALPVMSAASFLDLYETGFSASALELQQLGVGMLIAFVVAFLSVKAMTRLVDRFGFKWFGVYRIGLVLIYALCFMQVS